VFVVKLEELFFNFLVQRGFATVKELLAAPLDTSTNSNFGDGISSSFASSSNSSAMITKGTTKLFNQQTYIIDALEIINRCFLGHKHLNCWESPSWAFEDKLM
jgi:hypothetical protein